MVLYYSLPRTKQIQQSITVTVNSLDGFGQGVASYQGKTLFIKNVLPQEQVKIQIEQDKKHYAIARVVRYLKFSEQRLNPPCQYYAKCGGCDVQHMPLVLQYQSKIAALLHRLQTETGIDWPLDNVSLIIGPDYHYRRRARLSMIVSKQQLIIGFRESGSDNIINIDECPILVRPLQQLLMPLKACLNKLKDQYALGHIECVAVDSGIIFILRHMRPLTVQDQDYLLEFAIKYSVSFYLLGKTLVDLTAKLVPKPNHYYMVNQLQLSFSPLDFIQVNQSVNLKMIQQALEWLALHEDDCVLDLFCGMGNFSLPIAQVSRQVIGVEGVTALVEQAQLNAQFNQQYLAGNIQFYKQNLDDWQTRPAWWSTAVNKVLLDPARAGALEVVKQIVKLAPERIVYISCNPTTLVRDSDVLLKAGYHIRAVAILDMFPQTKHIESMMLFTRDGVN